ncbi:hypothetical protein CP985_07815 [Malaciobacter mytili LMG 24559]|uniref:PAS sensor-containing diguanylate cyclase/phosphodiesterase n=1 Tax=Malaciobacter mytili LMG 24559 TaxID=1032238 RepID=A0AAX2AG30_9BACT|nr:cache domain-containing protein [Malaciobacter mytili]AXH15258.1 Cache sensor-containing diguanylate cyclase/phosphodiesterase [Malaciobacter mytili LMG 24559]RXK15550.1 hypothetical protein CP985_07815 [Malaciobacter mytili LMG 24559]
MTRYKLSKIIFYIVVAISFISVAIIEIFDTTYEYNHFKKSTEELKKSFFEKEQENLKSEVNRAISLIEYNYQKQEELVKTDLKQRTYEAYNITLNIYNKYKNKKSKEEILELIKNSLRNVRFFDGYGYYSIYDFSGKTLLHGFNSEYENNYKLKSYVDINGKNSIGRIIDVAKEKKEGFVNWRFLSPKENTEENKKGYIKVFEPYNFIIVTADYISRIEKLLKEEALDRIRKISYDKKGYVFVLNKQGTILAHKYRKEIENKNINEVTNIKEKEILNILVNSVKSNTEAFISYSWFRPNTDILSDKLTYVKTFEKWNWIIGTGVYLDNMYEFLEKQEEALKLKMIYRLFYSLVFFLIISILIFYITKKISKNMDKTFSLFIDFFKKANTDNKKIDLKDIKFYEFSELAICANKMIETRVKNEEEIENKNKEVLINLSLLNEYKKAVDASAIVSKTDKEGVITFANDEFCKISGFKRDELLGAKHNLVKHPDTKKEVYKDLWSTILDKRVWKGVLKNRTKEGKTYYVKSSIVPILDVSGSIKEFIAIRYDVSDLINQEKRIRLQITDHLTKLPNRQKLLEDLENKDDLILAIFNIQRFKEINEYYGFEVGDKLLIELANVLQKKIDDNTVLYKLQGDEFALLTSKDKISLEEFKTLCAEILTSIKNLCFLIDSNKLEINLVVGISSEKNYFINAEMAKNHTKIENKELIVLDENKDIKESLILNINWTQKLKKALSEDRLVIFAQPIISNIDNKINKYECLVRMIDEDGTIISPFKFLNIAKKAKLYHALTQTVILKAFKYFHNKEVDFSINLTLEDILHKPTVALLENKLKEYPGISQKLILEIVEDEGIENYQDVSNFIETMKDLGCKIAIDDFGTGYSNFDYLMKLNVDFVKIDGSMIKYINQDLNAKIVTELIVSFTKKLNIKTIAEFVHSKEIHEIVTDMGIDYSQGFYLGEPKAIE